MSELLVLSCNKTKFIHTHTARLMANLFAHICLACVFGYINQLCTSTIIVCTQRHFNSKPIHNLLVGTLVLMCKSNGRVTAYTENGQKILQCIFPSNGGLYTNTYTIHIHDVAPSLRVYPNAMTISPSVCSTGQLYDTTDAEIRHYNI